MIAIKVGRVEHDVAVEKNGEVESFKISNNRTGFETLREHLSSNGHGPIGIEGGSVYGLPLVEWLGDRQILAIPFPKKGGRRSKNNKNALSVLTAMKAGAGRPMGSVDGRVKAIADRLIPEKDLPQGSFAWCVRNLVRDRERNVRELRRRKQRVRMVLAVVFPEFENIFKDPFGKAAITILESLPLPADIRRVNGNWPQTLGKLTPAKKEKLDALRTAAAESIGIHESRAHYVLTTLKVALEELRGIENEIKDQDGDIAELIAQSPWKKLLDITGVQSLSAAKIVSEIIERPRFMSASQMTGFAGLAPTMVQVLKDGGTRMRITRGGSAPFRTVVYQIAKSTVRADRNARALYERLVRERKTAGRPVKPALIRIMDHVVIPRIFTVYSDILGGT